MQYAAYLVLALAAGFLLGQGVPVPGDLLALLAGIVVLFGGIFLYETLAEKLEARSRSHNDWLHAFHR